MRLSVVFVCVFSSFSFGGETISDLGSPSYAERERAAVELRGMGFCALALLESNFCNEDIEIAMRCREIYEEYLFLDVPEYPSVWFVGPEHRFPEGREVFYNCNMSLCQIKCKKDMSLECYLQAKKIIDPFGNYECNGCDCWHFWADKRAERLASRILAKKMLLSGTEKNVVKKMLEDAAENYMTCNIMYQTKDIESKLWDFWSCPPGELVPKEEFVFPSY